ncbi:MAG: hypothetical protein K0R39_1900 [Symbiobacteriaceae bacterium]|jgi:uncharacterized protein YtpQ (UPF0354 family)|nr:hypothetical protein [Symbiobacteriaceae bacterium]
MGKALLSEAEFSRVIVNRARRERPDIRVEPMGDYLLLIRPLQGQQRVVSMAELYESYCQAPKERDEAIAVFLETRVYEEKPAICGSFAENQEHVMPQVVPMTLVEYCKQDNRELAAIPYLGGLAIAFVLDEEERYTYIHRRVMDDWGVSEMDLLHAAMENLQELGEGENHYQLGTEERTALVWETYDGYDASRILLSKVINAAAARVPGNPLIGIPNRDYMVLFSDVDPEFVAEMRERIRQDCEGHDYPITSSLFTLDGGVLVPLDEHRRKERVVN